MNYQTFCQMFKYQMHFSKIINKNTVELDTNILVPNPIKSM